MNHQRHLLLAGIAATLALAATAAGAQPPPLTATASRGGPEPNTAGPIDKPMVVEIAPKTYLINEFGADSMYLVIGKTRALAIDSGSGFFDYKGLIEQLTDLPYDVAITHGHPDHAGGIGQFDTVYMDPADTSMAKKITYEGRVQYGRMMRGMTSAALGSSIGYENVWAYSDASVHKWDRFPEVKPLHDGQVFDLGGRKVTVYHIGNHTPGSSIFIDSKSRILFSGDVANRNVGANDSVSSVIRGLIRIRDLRRDYDQTYTGHTAYANTINPLPQAPEILDDEIEAFRAVLRGDATLKTIPNHLFPERSLTVSIHGQALVGFNPDKLWDPGEPHNIP